MESSSPEAQPVSDEQMEGVFGEPDTGPTELEWSVMELDRSVNNVLEVVQHHTTNVEIALSQLLACAQKIQRALHAILLFLFACLFGYLIF